MWARQLLGTYSWNAGINEIARQADSNALSTHCQVARRLYFHCCQLHVSAIIGADFMGLRGSSPPNICSQGLMQYVSHPPPPVIGHNYAYMT